MRSCESHLRLPSGLARIRTTTGSLSALARPTPYQALRQRLLHTKLLPTEAFTHRRFLHTDVFHTDAFTQTLLHTDTTEDFAHGRFHTQALLHRNTFTHKHFCTQTLLHNRRFYTQTQCTQKLLQTNTFTQKHFDTQTLYTDTFTLRNFTQTEIGDPMAQLVWRWSCQR